MKKMPCCLDESPREDLDVSLQILSLYNTAQHVDPVTDPQVVREITQTDHLNKRLLSTFLQRMNVMDLPSLSDKDDDENANEFDD